MQSICGQTCCLSFYSTQGIQSLTIFFRIIYILYLSGFVFSFFVGWQLINSKLIYTFMCCQGVHREMQPRLTLHWTRTNRNNCNKAIKPLVCIHPKGNTVFARKFVQYKFSPEIELEHVNPIQFLVKTYIEQIYKTSKFIPC